ncbi:MAG TPA: hypothetical protein VGF25_05585 [Thermoleophilaceae bacterium]|jgi:hypothetical protein
MQLRLSLALILLAGTLALPAAAGGAPRASEVVPGQRVGLVKIGMTKRQVDARLHVVTRVPPHAYLYKYPKVSFFEVVFSGGRVDAVITQGRRFNYRGVRLGQRRVRAARGLRRRHFTSFDCAGLNGMAGYFRKTIRYDLDQRKRRLQTLTVGHDVRPSCE